MWVLSLRHQVSFLRETFQVSVEERCYTQWWGLQQRKLVKYKNIWGTWAWLLRPAFINDANKTDDLCFKHELQ